MTTYLGASNAIRFRLEKGLLTQVVLSVQRKSPVAVTEILSGGTVLADITTPYDVTNANGGFFVRAGQSLSNGRRTLELHHERTGDVSTARLELTFDLDSPLQWILQGPYPFQRSEPGRAERVLDNRISLAVTAANIDLDSHGSCIVSLEAGRQVVSVTVASSPVFRCGRTAIACRPHQLREAAITASLLSDEQFTPIIRIAAPPEALDSYLAAYEAFAEAHSDFMNAAGTPLAQEEIAAAGEAGEQQYFDLVQRVSVTRERLSPYRSWLKYNAMVDELTSGLGIERVILLHDFTDDDLIVGDPGLNQGKTGLLFSSALETVAVDTDDLMTLTDRLARVLGCSETNDRGRLTVDAGDHNSFVAALFVALQTGQPIQAGAGAETVLDAALEQSNNDGEEAVLVELNGSIDSLIGAQYATYRGARLITVPQPDIAGVQRAVAERQRDIALAATRHESDGSIADTDRLNRLAQMTTTPDPLQQIEQVVTAQVPDQAVRRVGNRRLTAFTAGVPYSFVRSPEGDWSSKPIGHVSVDASLIVLNEIFCAGRERTGGRFALVFDPGFFRRSETPEVVKAARSYFTYPILLSGTDANNQHLMSLPTRLPVELMFFNTHGADDSIVLQYRGGGTHVLTRSKITQWLHLPHRPIVINNSCQSWTGVGREFIRAGARGYVGTLWSVPTIAAAKIGEALIQRVTAGDRTMAEAIVDIGDVGTAGRSYIYAGTVNGRLDEWPDRDPAPGEVPTFEAKTLIRAAYRISDPSRPLLRREIKALREKLTEAEIAASLDQLVIRLDELTLLVHSPPNEFEASMSTVELLISEIDGLLESLDLPDDIRRERLAERRACTAQINRNLGDIGAAIRDFEHAAELTAKPLMRADMQLRAGNMMVRIGRWDEAASILREARATFKAASNSKGYVQTTGVLGQLYKRLGQLDDAVQCVVEGFTAAADLDRASARQAVFKNDESALHELRGDLDAAITAAVEALRLARQTGDPRDELAPLGRLVRLNIEKREFDDAERDAQRGLRYAEYLGVAREAADFEHDLATISMLRDASGATGDEEAAPEADQPAARSETLQLITVEDGQDAIAMTSGGDEQAVTRLTTIADRLKWIKNGVFSGMPQLATDVGATLAPLIRDADDDFKFAEFCTWATVLIGVFPPLFATLSEALGLSLMRAARNSADTTWMATSDKLTATLNRVREVYIDEDDDEEDEHDDEEVVSENELELMRSLLALLNDWRAGASRSDLAQHAAELDMSTNGMLGLSQFVRDSHLDNGGR